MKSTENSSLSQRRRTGMTPVETVSILSILFLGAALASPALYSARAAARQTQCLSNLKAIAIGLHSYHSVHNTFPPGWTASSAEPGPQLRHGWMVALLPMIEQGRLDPTEIITHRLPLDRAIDGYRIFANHEENVLKVVLEP